MITQAQIDRALSVQNQLTSLKVEREAFYALLRPLVDAANKAYTDAQTELNSAFPHGWVTIYDLPIADEIADAFDYQIVDAEHFVANCRYRDRDDEIFSWTIKVAFDPSNQQKYVDEFIAEHTATLSNKETKRQASINGAELAEFERLSRKFGKPN